MKWHPVNPEAVFAFLAAQEIATVWPTYKTYADDVYGPNVAVLEVHMDWMEHYDDRVWTVRRTRAWDPSGRELEYDLTTLWSRTVMDELERAGELTWDDIHTEYLHELPTLSKTRRLDLRQPPPQPQATYWIQEEGLHA